MSEMSPLAKGLMLILRNGAIGSAGLLVLFICIEIYQRRGPDGHLNMNRQDWGFMGLLIVLFFVAIFLARAITKEVKNNS
jgi:hypothetical protein